MKYFWLLALLVPVTAFAISYETDMLPYSDIPSDMESQVAISTLTEIGVLEGNPDGTFRPNRGLNRAEFVTIAERLLAEDGSPVQGDCFPDVRADAWYAYAMCHLKFLGIISGNALPGLLPEEYPFAPERGVTYEEAVKILVGIFGVELRNVEGEWYEKYIDAAKRFQIDLPDSAPGQPLSRVQMARLTIQFYAYANGELDVLRIAQSGESSHSSHSSFSSHSSQISSSASFASSYSSAIYDPYITDGSTDQGILVLGNVTHILAAASLFANDEAIIVDEFLIDLVSGNSSLEAMNIYDHDGKFIGRATLDGSVSGGTRYHLPISNQNIRLPHRDDYSFYVRGVLRPEDQGGVSGGSIEVDEMGITGVGFWSNRDYEEWTSGETFSESAVARSTISDIRNAGDSTGNLIEGSGQEIGAFFFAGATGHSSADVKITAIDFTLGVTGGTTVSNAYLRADGSSDTHSCTVGGSTISCSSLPDLFGKIDDGSRTLRLYGDIAIPNASQSAGLQVSINDPGSIGSAGDITWSDGTTTFTWIDTPNQPVARGTYYSY